MENKEIIFAEPTEPIGKVAELFAGVGGFRVGLAKAGFQTVFSNQWEPSTKVQHASDVYVARFGPTGHSNVDIATLQKIDTDFDVLVGGFPCQDYSVAKAAKTATGLEGKKGVLWWEILRLTLEHKPKYIFLENVDRLLKSPTSQRGRDFAVMLSTLGRAGYVVEWRVVNAAHYGLPQRRARVFIVATRLDLANSSSQDPNSLLVDGVLTKSFPVKEQPQFLGSIAISADAVAVSDHFPTVKEFTSFGNAGTFIDGTAHIWKVEPNWDGPRTFLKDVLVNADTVPDEFWISDEKLPQWRYLKGSKSIERTHRESGFKYLYSEGAIAFPDPVNKPSRTILTGEGGTTPSRFKHVIYQANGFRRLLPIELERLCGFPDDWTNPPLDKALTPARRAFFMGNALVVGLVEMVGAELANRIRTQDKY